jgi:hypothetical protein
MFRRRRGGTGRGHERPKSVHQVDLADLARGTPSKVRRWYPFHRYVVVVACRIVHGAESVHAKHAEPRAMRAFKANEGKVFHDR